MSKMTNTAWRCHAKPAGLGGQTCGFLNIPGERKLLRAAMGGGECCAECGCTRIAGTDRYKRTAGVLARLYVVTYEVLCSAGHGTDPVRVTVIADTTDSAYAEARLELGESFTLGSPIAADPVVAP